MMRSISSLFARRDAGSGAVESVQQGRSRPAPPDAAAPGCLPGYLRLRRARTPVSAAPRNTTASSAAPGQPSSLQLQQWRAWSKVQRRAGTGADCDEVIRRMKAYLDRGHSLPDTLDLSGLRLTNLPPNMPATVFRLNLSSNAFTELPANLPPRVQVMNLDFNRITHLSGSLPPELAQLSANNNLLQQIPESLPRSISLLKLNHNEIEYLPASLPTRLAVLQVRNNRLRELPQNLPRRLKSLTADDNHIECLPETLPDSLQTLRVKRNAIRALPQRWPAELRFLRATDNRIEALPVSLFQSLPQHCSAHLRANRLPASEQARVHAQVAALLVSGVRVPSVELAEPVVLGNYEARPLIIAAAGWHTVEHAQALPAWAGFQDEPGAQAFAAFLDGLGKTNNVFNPGFRSTIATWLGRLAAEPELRATSFNEAIGATESCVDRIGLTLNAMKKLEIEHDVKHGRYDRDLPQLVGLARATFRLDALAAIATQLAQADPDADEISIFLGLQVELRRTLVLPIDAQRITFLGLANLESKHMKQAEIQVQQAENEGFPAFLAGWAPWRSAIERLDPASGEAASEAMSAALEGPFEAALTARLAPAGLEHDDDARRNAGRGVMDQIVGDIHHAQTVAFLDERNLSSLLHSPWQTGTTAVRPADLAATLRDNRSAP